MADGAVLLREGLVRLLAEDGHQVVATAGDGPGLVEAVLRHRPDVSVVDLRMPPTHTDEGLRAAITARSHPPGAPMLVLSQYVERPGRGPRHRRRRRTAARHPRRTPVTDRGTLDRLTGQVTGRTGNASRGGVGAAGRTAIFTSGMAASPSAG